MTGWLWPVLTGIAFVVAMLAALGSKVLRHFSHFQLEMYSRQRKRPELFGKILDIHDDAAMAAEKLHALASVVFIVGGMMWWRLPDAGRTGWQPLVAFVAAMLLVNLTISVWLPWAVTKYWSAPFLYNTWRVWFVLMRVCQPLNLGVRFFEFLVRRLADQPDSDTKEEEEEAFESEIMTMVTAGQRDGLLEEDAREMIEGVLEMDDVDVADIMTPRSEVDMLDVNWPWSQVLEHIVKFRRTRLPVYQRDQDDIIGILHVKDLLPELAGGNLSDENYSAEILRAMLRQPLFIPRSKPVDVLLQEFLEKRKHLAIVVDEYHAVSGVVTIEDVLEEIVGEIVDEFDKAVEDTVQIESLGESKSEVAGNVHLDELNQELGVDLPESDEYDTVAGLVISRLGYIPAVGERVEVDGVRITVSATNRRRIEKVIVETDVGEQKEVGSTSEPA